MPDFTGTYEMISTENFDSYLKAVGVGFAKRMLAGTVKPSITISVDDDTYTIKTSSALKTTEIKFKSGVEFDEETADGRIAKTTVTVDGNKFTHIQKIGNDQAMTVREFKDNQMTATFSCNGVTATRVYAKKA